MLLDLRLNWGRLREWHWVCLFNYQVNELWPLLKEGAFHCSGSEQSAAPGEESNWRWHGTQHLVISVWHLGFTAKHLGSSPELIHWGPAGGQPAFHSNEAIAQAPTHPHINTGVRQYLICTLPPVLSPTPNPGLCVSQTTWPCLPKLKVSQTWTQYDYHT
jgi:hypothetical protein